MIANVGENKFTGVELAFEMPLTFLIDDIVIGVEIHYKENPYSRGHRGWRTLEYIQTSQYWIDEEKGFSEYYVLYYLKDSFKMDFPNKNIPEEEMNKLFSDIFSKLKEILHERKIEIPGYTIETGDEE